MKSPRKNRIKRFEAPTLDEVIAYWKENEFPSADTQPRQFHCYYESNGWKVGKNPMRNWRMAASGWAYRAMERNGIKSKPFFRSEAVGFNATPCEEPTPIEREIAEIQKEVDILKASLHRFELDKTLSYSGDREKILTSIRKEIEIDEEKIKQLIDGGDSAE